MRSPEYDPTASLLGIAADFLLNAAFTLACLCAAGGCVAALMGVFGR